MSGGRGRPSLWPGCVIPRADPAARQRRTRPPPFGCLLGVVMFAPPLSVESPAGKFMLTSVGRSLMECFAE